MSVLIDEDRDTTAMPALPDRYEVIDGEIVEVPEMGAYSSAVANTLRDHLYEFGKSSHSGRRPVMDMLFRVPLPDDESRNRRPDVAFISFDRWPQDKPIAYSGNPMEVVPDLVVEVASPSDSGDELLDKADEYLRAGVRVVWIVFPLTKLALIYEPNANPRAVRVHGQLDGGAAFPDLIIPMAGLFPPIVAD